MILRIGLKDVTPVTTTLCPATISTLATSGTSIKITANGKTLVDVPDLSVFAGVTGVKLEDNNGKEVSCDCSYVNSAVKVTIPLEYV